MPEVSICKNCKHLVILRHRDDEFIPTKLLKTDDEYVWTHINTYKDKNAAFHPYHLACGPRVKGITLATPISQEKLLEDLVKVLKDTAP